MATVILRRAGKDLLQMPLAEEAVTIGRDSSNHLVIHSPDVSRRHARIRRDGDRFVYEDQGSANGTYLLGKRVATHVLSDGDELTLGEHTLLFVASAAGPAAAALPTPEFAEIDEEDLGFDDDAITAPAFDLGELDIPPAPPPAAADDEATLRDHTIVFDLSPQDLHAAIFGDLHTDELDKAIDATIPVAVPAARLAEPKPKPTPRSDRLEVLFEITKAVEAAHDLPTVLREILDKAIAVMDSERGFIMLVDPASGELRVHVARDRDGDITGVDRERVSRSLMHRARETGKPVLVLDAQAGEWSTQSVAINSIHSALCAPLKTRDQVTGVLYVDHRSRANVFSREDVAFFTTFALQASAVIQNSRAYWELVDSLFEASDDFVAICRPDGVLDQVNQAGARLLDAREPLAGRHFSDLVAPDDRDRARQLCADGIADGVVSARELQLVPAEGRPVPMSVAGFRLRGKGGKAIGLCLIGRDLSAQKFLVRQLERQKTFIQKTFGRYLSEEVVESILESPVGTQLGGEKRMVTIMMSDLRGFTQLSERISPESVVAMLNHYLGTMTELLMKHHGTIDEFIGDAILAIFGAPITREDDAERACACAVAMQLAMQAVNERNVREGFPPIQMGIGLNSGEVVVGNIGSAKRAKYGVVGGAVNTTGRIESYTIGGQILISDDCRKQAGENLILGRQLSVRAKGNKEPIVVHELLGVGGSYDLRLPERVETYVTVSREVPIGYSVLEGKHMSNAVHPASLLKLTSSGIVLRTKGPLDVLENVKMELLGEDGSPAASEVYGKVTEADASDPEVFSVRITAMPPAAEEFLDKLRKTAG